MSATSSKTQRRARRWVGIGLVIALPFAVLAVLVSSLGGRVDHVDRVEGAVVNLDQIVTSGDTPMAAGRMIAGALTSPDDPNDVGIAWRLADEQDAEDGLASGRYAAVVTIPEDFSQAVVSAQSDDPHQATYAIVTADGSQPLAAAVADDVAKAAGAEFGQTITTAVVGQVFSSLANLGGAASQIGEGTSQLTSASGQLADGVTQLTDGLGQVSTGADQLADGASQLASGVTTFGSGVVQVAQGASQAAAGSAPLTSGAGQLATGASGLSSGLDQLASQTAALPGATSQLATAAQAAAQLTSGLGTASPQLSAGAAGLATAITGDGTAANPGIAASTATLSSGASAISGALTGLTATYGSLGGAAAQTHADASALNGAVQQLLSTCLAAPVPDATCQALAASGIDTQAATLTTETATVDAGLNGSAGPPVNPGLLPSLSALATQSGQLSGGLAQLSSAVNDPQTAAGGLTLGQVATGVADGARQLDAALTHGTTVSGQAVPSLVSLTGSVASGTSQLAGSASALNSGVSQLAAGATQVSSGARGLSAGLGQFSAGIGQLADGTSQLAGSVGQLENGASGVADGASQLATGLEPVTSGSQQLADGAQQLDAGVQTFAQQLTEQMSALPSYTADQAEQLANVVSQPIVSTSTSANDSSYETSSAAALLTLALWAGAVALFLVLRAVPARVQYTIGRPLRVVLSSLVPALAVGGVGAVLATVLLPALGVRGANLLVVALLALVGIACFAAMVQALVAWWGKMGQVVAVVLMAVQIGCLDTVVSLAAAPGWARTVAGWLPLPALADGLSTQFVGSGTGSVGTALTVLVLWGLVAVFATAWRVRRRQAAGPDWVREARPASARVPAQAGVAG